MGRLDAALFGGRGGLEPVVMGAAAPFGRNARDDLVGIGDITGLAVNAIRGIDLQVCTGAIRIVFHLVYRGRTEILAGIAVLNRAAMVTNIKVRNLQVRGLVFLMMCARVEHVRNLIEGKLAIGFDSYRRIPRALVEAPHVFVAGQRRVSSVQSAAASKKLQAPVRDAAPEAVLEPLVIVAHLPKLLVHPAFPPAVFKTA